MRYLIATPLFATLIGCTTAAVEPLGPFPQGYNEIAVVAEDTSTHLQRHPGAVVELEQGLTSRLLDQGYRVRNRSELAGVMDEHKLDRSGLVNAKAQRLGELLQVDGILVARVLQINHRRSVSDAVTQGFARMIPYVPTANVTPGFKCEGILAVTLVDVKTGEAAWTRRAAPSSRSFGTDDLGDVIQTACFELGRGITPCQSVAKSNQTVELH